MLVNFAVRDTGCGIPPPALNKIFSRYVSEGGVGIGLYLSKMLIESLGSSMDFSSPWDPNSTGTSFDFTLALPTYYELSEDSSNKDAVTPSPPEIIHPAKEPHGDDHQKDSGLDALSSIMKAAHVLVADDLLMNRKLLGRVFKTNFGSIVTEASSAEEFDLIIIDEHFGPGGKTGSVAIKEIRSKGMSNEVIVLCSGNALEMGSRGAPGLIDALWGKPFPSWTDGSMQAQLSQLFRKRAMSTTSSFVSQNGPDIV
ncbi:MAG: hypothetical protein SGPRY_015054 [Prymnesium sp.]